MSHDGAIRAAPLLTTSRGTWRYDAWVAALMAAVTLIAFSIAVTTLPTSGPYCVADCVGYPYTDIAHTIPSDFLWMYPALLVGPLFMTLMVSLHERAPAERRRFTRLGFGVAVLATTMLTADYFVQLRVVQPSILLGETAGLEVWSQNNPHGVFIALEEAGYLLLALAFPFAALALTAPRGVERAVRWVFGAGFVCVLASLAYYSAAYGFQVEYRFEVAAISFDWLALIVTGALLAVHWWRAPELGAVDTVSEG